MTRPEDRQLEWIDRPLAGLVKLAWPIAVSMVGYTVMTLTGTARHLYAASRVSTNLIELCAYTPTWLPGPTPDPARWWSLL